MTTGISIFAVFPFFRWLAQRVRASGLDKIFCLAMIPLINLIILIFLLFKKTAKAPSPLCNESININLELESTIGPKGNFINSVAAIYE